MAISRSSYHHSSRRHHHAQTHHRHAKTHHSKAHFRDAVQKVLDSNVPWTIYTSAVIPTGSTTKILQASAGNDLYFGFDIGTSAQWLNILTQFNNANAPDVNARQKFEIANYSSKVRVTSTCITPGVLSCYEVVPRQGTATTPAGQIFAALTAMTPGAVNNYIPNNITFYMLPLFTTQYKIIRRTTYKIQPGECKTFHFSIPGHLPRVVNSDYGQLSNYDRHQGRSVVFRFSGEPIHDSTTSTLVNLSLPNVDCIADYICKGRAVNVAGTSGTQDLSTIRNVSALGTITSQATVADEYGQKVSGTQQ